MIGKGFLDVAMAGVKNAGKSLEMMVPSSISMEILWAGSMPTARLSEISGNPEALVLGAYVMVTGDAPGHALLIFSRESALLLTDLVMGQPTGTTNEVGEMEESLIKEIANILTSSYLTAIGDYWHITLLPEPPLLAQDMTAALIDNVLLNSGSFEEETVSIVTRFRTESGVMDGLFLYIPEIISDRETEGQ
jgi:chemotaxis protein CheC